MVARRADNLIKAAVQGFFESLQEGERFNFEEMAAIVGEEVGINFLEDSAGYAKLLEAAEAVLVDAGIADWAGRAIDALVVAGFDDAVASTEIVGGRRSADARWESTPGGKLLQAYALGNRWASEELRWRVLEASGPTFAFNFLKAGYIKSREELEWILENRLEAPGASIWGVLPWEQAKVINDAKLRFGLLTEEELEEDSELKHPWLRRR